MKTAFKYFLCILTILSFSSGKKQTILFDWTKITDKNCYVKYTTTIYGKDVKKGFDQKLTNIISDTSTITLDQKTTGLLQAILTDTSNFVEQFKYPICNIKYFTKAFVVYEHGKVAGIINIGCNDDYWVFDPGLKDHHSALIHKKAVQQKQELFNE